MDLEFFSWCLGINLRSEDVCGEGGLKRITLIALFFIGDEKQTIGFVSAGLVCLMNSFCRSRFLANNR